MITVGIYDISETCNNQLSKPGIHKKLRTNPCSFCVRLLLHETNGRGFGRQMSRYRGGRLLQLPDFVRQKQKRKKKKHQEWHPSPSFLIQSERLRVRFCPCTGCTEWLERGVQGRALDETSSSRSPTHSKPFCRKMHAKTEKGHPCVCAWGGGWSLTSLQSETQRI